MKYFIRRGKNIILEAATPKCPAIILKYHLQDACVAMDELNSMLRSARFTLY